MNMNMNIQNRLGVELEYGARGLKNAYTYLPMYYVLGILASENVQQMYLYITPHMVRA